MPDKPITNLSLRPKIQQAKKTTAQKGYGGRWQRVRLNWLSSNPYCVFCKGLAEMVDHKIPLREGGRTEGDNLQSCCNRCHNLKHKGQLPPT